MPKKFYGLLPRPALTPTKLLASYLLAATAALAIPSEILWFKNLAPNALQMYDNDRAGCCTFAAVGNLVICQSTNAGQPITPDAGQILQGYISETGYDPQTGANDTGCVETDVLQLWKANGIAGNVATDWCEIRLQNPDHLKLGCWYLGGCYLGLNVTAEAEAAIRSGPAMAARVVQPGSGRTCSAAARLRRELPLRRDVGKVSAHDLGLLEQFRPHGLWRRE